MGKKTSFILKILAASLFVMLLTVFVMTDNVTLSSSDDGAAVDTDEVADGTYTGTGEGFNGPIEVEVTVEGGEIGNVEVLSHTDSPDISDPAFETVPQAIVDSNSTDVDVASGATFSSEGIMSAVNNALSGDAGADVAEDASEEDSEEASDETFEDGTHTGTAEGRNGPIEVEVTVENGEITDVTILEHSESEDISDPAIENVPAAIVENNSTEVDVASGATLTSEGIMAAVENALFGTVAADYEDGTHTGTAEGRNGPIDVEVIVANGEITNVTILEHSETEDISDPAIEEVPQAIVESNSTEVDVASGATLTSEGIMAAVENALFETEAASYEDGTYTASVEGHNGPLEVEVTIENGELSNVAVLDHSETEDLSDPAITDVPAAIVENNSTDVDVASGATVTSEAIMAAVDLALEEASGETTVSYTDGSYEGSTEGHNGPLNVEVTVENDEISNVTVLDHSETEDLSDPAIADVPAAIVGNNSTDVDVASGATVTSEAIMDAVDNALEEAN